MTCKQQWADVFEQFTKNCAKLWKAVFLQFTMGLTGSSLLCNLIKPLTEAGFGFILRYFHLSPYEIEAPSSIHCVVAYWYWVEGHFSWTRKLFSEMYSWHFPIVTFFIHNENDIAFRRFLNSSVTRGHFQLNLEYQFLICVKWFAIKTLLFLFFSLEIP
jgi:hypothetical protein